jgi:hypothetical protein
MIVRFLNAKKRLISSKVESNQQAFAPLKAATHCRQDDGVPVKKICF